MKHLKLMMAALAMMMGLTMTSCFDDEDSYETVITSIAKLKQGLAGGYEFVTTEGFVIIPDAASVSKMESNNKIKMDDYLNEVCYVIYSVEGKDPIKKEDTSIKDVTLEGFTSLSQTVEIVSEKGAANDSINKAAIISLGKDINEHTKPSLFDQSTVFLCIDYFIVNKQHSFTLVNYGVDELVEEGVLTLYLRHNNNGDSMQNTTSTAYYWANQGYVWSFYHAFDITRPLMDYQLKYGKKPEAIGIVTMENLNSPSLEQAKEFTHYIEYKEKK